MHFCMVPSTACPAATQENCGDSITSRHATVKHSRTSSVVPMPSPEHGECQPPPKPRRVRQFSPIPGASLRWKPINAIVEANLTPDRDLCSCFRSPPSVAAQPLPGVPEPKSRPRSGESDTSQKTEKLPDSARLRRAQELLHPPANPEANVGAKGVFSRSDVSVRPCWRRIVLE